MRQQNHLLRIWICRLFCVILSLPALCRAEKTEIMVSPDGPVKTLAAARDKLRQLRLAGTETGPVRICLRAGTYFLDEPVVLTQQDGGTETAPVVWEALAGETVRLVAGRPVKDFKPLTDSAIAGRFRPECRDKILQADLKAQGIADYGTQTTRGFSRPITPAGLELFFQDRPMTLARWPNTGWLLIDQVPGGADSGRFTCREDRPGTWAPGGDIWVHGFWTQDWADSYERVKSIDPASRTIETHPPHGVYGYTPKHRFYFLNVPEELDSPGEWYMDRTGGMLYFWPPAPMAGQAPMVSMIQTAISLEDCAYVTIRGMTIECTRGTAVRIRGGQGNRIENCVIRNAGNRCVEISGGRQNGVQGCDIYAAGDGGIDLSGGDTKTLTPAGHFADDNHIHHFNRWCLTYRPAIGIHGVGNRAAHNRLHDGPHSAIHLGGNDHLIEYNEVFNVCTESDDVGAFYSGRSWVARGTVIRYNFFHDIHSARDHYSNGSRVVYLDDAASGFTITGNVFYKAGSLCAINVGGGRDNRIENNVFVECKKGVLIDTRGVGWAKDFISENGEWKMYEKLKDVRHDQPPYSQHYPKLKTILDEAPAEPRGNVLINNLAVRTPLLDMPKEYQHLLENSGNWSTDTNPGFANVPKRDFSLKKDSVVFKQIPGFEPIPFDQIKRCPASCAGR